MKRLTVFTERHERTLKDFIREAEVEPWVEFKNEGRAGGLFFARLVYEPTDGFVSALLVALEEIAMADNPVYNCAPKLKAAAPRILGERVHLSNEEILRRFLRENSKLHLEGYIAFRMRDFTAKLDDMTYGLIKKLSNP